MLSWVHQLCQDVKPSEYTLIEASTFAYHCTRLLNQIQKALIGNSELMPVTYLYILDQLDQLEKDCSFSCAEPSILSIGVHAYQGNFRMHLLASILAFLRRAYKEECSHQQQIHSAAIQERCIENFRTTATNILRTQGMSQYVDHISSDKFHLGWADAIMVYGSLRTIFISPVSLIWQRNAASSICATIKERLGFQFLL